MTSNPLLKGEIKLREYQESAVAVALNQNTLVVLPTGLGKTIIALFVAAQRLGRFLDSKLLFLAPTKPLAQQHVESFKKHLVLEDNQFALMTGEEPAQNRKVLWEKARAIFATPQTIENDLISGNISLRDVSLVVFDEAHRAVGEYAYVFIAKKYAEQGRNPLSLALTASPGSSKEKIDEIIKNLNVEDVEIRTDKDRDVRPYVERMEAEWVKVELPENFKRLRDLLNGAMKEYLGFLKKRGYLPEKDVRTIGKRDLLELQGQLRRQMLSGEKVWDEISDAAALLKVQHGLELLETQGIAALDEYLKRLRTQKSKAVNVLMKRDDIRSAVGLAQILHSQGVDHPKLIKLKEIVKDQLGRKRYSKIIVFTHYRDSVDKVVSVLEGEKGIAARKLIGQAAKGRQKGMTQKEQKEILGDFNNSIFNVLVATSVHPDEYIVLKNPNGLVEIRAIGEFVESFLNNKRRGNLSKSIRSWKALSTDGKKVDFYPITEVHRHIRRSKVVDVRLNNGFSTWVTEDHSLFTFDERGRLKASEPRKDMFVNVGFATPNYEHVKQVDVVKELIQNAPEEVLEKVFCTFSGLSQARMRELSTDYRILKALGENTLNVEALSRAAGVVPGTVTRSTRRMVESGFMKIFVNSRHSFRSVTKLGRGYLAFLRWFFKHQRYHKRKYRMTIRDAMKAPRGAEKFCELNVGVWYGKATVPRYMQINEDLAEFLGWYVSEGSSRSTKSTSDIHLAAQDKDVQKRMANSVSGGLGLKANTTWRGVDVNDQIAHYLVKYVFRCGVGAHHKEVPNVIFSSPNECKWSFLEAYAVGDGHITKKRVVLTTVSRKLATGLVVLLRQLGIKKITLGRDHTYRVCINEPLSFAKVMEENRGNRGYYDTMPNALCSRKAFERYGNRYVSTQKVNGACRRLQAPQGKTCFDFIKSIGKLEKQPKYVYDISIKGTERFMGGVGLVTLHNSVGEEGLDIEEVDLVVFYEPIPSEIRTIQRRGRTARKKPGRLVVLITAGTKDETYFWSAFHKERRMRAAMKEVKRDFGGRDAPGQSSLKSFIERKETKEEKMYVYVDQRERNSGIAKKLSEMGAQVDVKQLEVADFLVSKRVAIERKTIADFLQSLIDGRLMDQMSEMCRNFEGPILILEGDACTLYTERNIHPNAIRGAIAAIAVNFGIPIIYTTGPDDTAAFIYVLAKREQEGKTKEIALRGEKKAMSLNEWQRFVVESLPNVSAVMAKRLLKHFGSVRKVFDAGEEDLQEVDGVADIKAKRIKEIIDSEYKED